jgi:hypothetical protein
MRNHKPELPETIELRRLALSQWDSEGGAGPHDPQEVSHSPHAQTDVTSISNMGIVQLRIRVIALENLIIAVLAEGTEDQRNLARKMAELISPQEGASPHPLTIRAAAHMVDLIQRSLRFS